MSNESTPRTFVKPTKKKFSEMTDEELAEWASAVVEAVAKANGVELSGEHGEPTAIGENGSTTGETTND